MSQPIGIGVWLSARAHCCRPVPFDTKIACKRKCIVIILYFVCWYQNRMHVGTILVMCVSTIIELFSGTNQLLSSCSILASTVCGIWYGTIPVPSQCCILVLEICTNPVPYSGIVSVTQIGCKMAPHWYRILVPFWYWKLVPTQYRILVPFR